MFNRVLYIKRVIATGGQTIDLRDGKVYIDGKLLEEDYIADTVKTYTQSMDMPVTVPEGCVFVMGDNREWSKDSRDRTVGILRNEQVVGKAVFRLLPFAFEDSFQNTSIPSYNQSVPEWVLYDKYEETLPTPFDGLRQCH